MSQHTQAYPREPQQDTPSRLFEHRRNRSGGIAAHAVGVATMILDESGIVRYCNATAAGLFRARTHELAGRHVTALIPDLPFNANTPGYNVAFAAFWAGEDRRRLFVASVNRRDCSLLLFVSLDRMELKGGHQILLNLRPAVDMGFFHDVSRQIQMQAQRTAESASKLRKLTRLQSYSS